MIFPGFSPGLRAGLSFLSGVAPILYDFAGGIYPPVSVSRASTGYVDDLAGNQSSVAANVLRQSNRGALIEPGSTNYNRNSSLQGAVVGSPGTLPTNWLGATAGGLTRSVVGLGTLPNGMDYVDVRFSGTSTSTSVRYWMEATGVALATQGQIVTVSFYAALVGGSLANVSLFRVMLNEFQGSTSVTAGYITNSLTSTLSRKTGSRTMTGAATDNLRPGFDFTFASGVAIDLTIRFAWPQTELGAIATSPIRTTGSTLARAADVATINIPAGIVSIRYTFDDAATQDVAVSPGTYTIPTTFEKYIAKMELRP